MFRRSALLAGGAAIEAIVLSLSGEVMPRALRGRSYSFWLGGVALGSFALLLAGSATANALTFTQGDLVVSVEGNGDGSASGGTAATGNTGGSANAYQDNQAAPLSLYEFTTTGAIQSPVGVLTLPQSQSGNNAPVSGEYGSSSEAQLQLSGNGRYLTIAGYAINAATYNSNFDQNGASLLPTPTGTALAQSCNTSSPSLCTGNPGVTVPQVQRVIATINANGVVDSSTTLGNVFNTNNPRSVYSPDGKSFYISGQGSGNANDTTGGVFYVPTLGPNANPTPITGTDATSTGNPPNNLGQDTRGVQIYNNTLYVSVDTKQGSNSARDFIGTLGTAGSPPTTLANGGNGPTPLTGFGALSGAGKDTGKVTINTVGNLNGNQFNSTTTNNHNLINLSPAGFFFAAPNVLYVADTGSPKNDSNGDTSTSKTNIGDGGLQKWINSVADGSGTWSLAYTLTVGLQDFVQNNAASGTTGLLGLTGEVVNGEVELFATNYTIGDTDQTYLYGIEDTLSFTLASQAVGESICRARHRASRYELQRRRLRADGGGAIAGGAAAFPQRPRRARAHRLAASAQAVRRHRLTDAVPSPRAANRGLPFCPMQTQTNRRIGAQCGGSLLQHAICLIFPFCAG